MLVLKDSFASQAKMCQNFFENQNIKYEFQVVLMENSGVRGLNV